MLNGGDSEQHQTCRRKLAREVEPDLLEVEQSDLVLCCGRAAIGPIHPQNLRQVVAIALLSCVLLGSAEPPNGAAARCSTCMLLMSGAASTVFAVIFGTPQGLALPFTS
jgi:hypothetical protein